MSYPNKYRASRFRHCPFLEGLESRTVPGFLAPVDYPVLHAPTHVLVADVNNDGIPDVITADHEGMSVSVLLGNGDGSFQPARNFATGSGPQTVQVGDFNGDGIPDLVTAENGSNTVSVLLGNGDGSFQAPISQSVGHHPYFLAPGDFDGDGRLDLAVVNYLDGDLLILLGNGDGTFRVGPDYAVGFAPTSVVAADLRGDGRLDLVVTNKGDPYGNGGEVRVFAGNGDGTFQAPVPYAAGLLPWSVAVADLNGDGIPDLAVANRGSQDVSVLLGNGDGSFQPAQEFAAGPGATAVAVGDFNGDGIPDLATANFFGDGVSVLLGNGDGSFQQALAIGANGPIVRYLAVGDFNGDGYSDIVVANEAADQATVLLNAADWAGPPADRPTPLPLPAAALVPGHPSESSSEAPRSIPADTAWSVAPLQWLDPAPPRAGKVQNATLPRWKPPRVFERLAANAAWEEAIPAATCLIVIHVE